MPSDRNENSLGDASRRFVAAFSQSAQELGDAADQAAQSFQAVGVQGRERLYNLYDFADRQPSLSLMFDALRHQGREMISLDPYQTFYADYGRLNDAESGDAIRIMLRHNERAAGSPAEAWEVSSIPNGVFNVTYEGVSYEYNIHTVQDGTLQHQRVVKIKHPGTGVFKAFGHLSTAGTLVLWRRFRNDSDSNYVRVAEMMLARLMQNVAVVEQAFLSGNAFMMGNRTNNLACRAHLRCSICNENLAQHAEEVRQRRCSDHYHPVTLHPDTIRQQQEEREAEQARAQAARAARAERLRQERLQAIQDRIPRCELGTGEVQ